GASGCLRLRPAGVIFFVPGPRRTRDMAAAAAADDAVAADIICSLRGADLAGWTPPWSKRGRPMEEARELSWPAMARGKRSRRRSPASSSATAAGGKAARCARSSPASPLDYSAGSASLRSGASTSGGEDGAFCSPWHRRAATAPATTTKTTTKVRALISIHPPIHPPRLPRPCRRPPASLWVLLPPPPPASLSPISALYFLWFLFALFDFFPCRMTKLPLLVSSCSNQQRSLLPFVI
uniref:Uncharacterized protein n=1 Tax=Aegilops tauschii subsp. strangulata TaxID=200361 RepID=A0A453NH57_AEGTS